MLITSNLHTHTTFCDGRYTIEEMVLEAINKGFATLGISPHAYAPFDKRTPGLTNVQGFISEMQRVKEKYKNKITLLTGIELDYYAEKNFATDYVIGSVHYIKKGKEYWCFENGYEEAPLQCQKRYSNVFDFVKEYYDLTVKMVSKHMPDIVGHFDLLTKLNRNDRIFNENSVEYKNYALLTVDKILKIKPDIIFEVNAHALYRHFREEPYPSRFILEDLLRKNVRVMLSSDAHDIDAIGYKFNELTAYLKSVGFNYLCEFKNGGFVQTKI